MYLLPLLLYMYSNWLNGIMYYLMKEHLYFIAELSNDSYSTVALGGEEGSPAGGGGAGATGGARYAATPPYLRTHSPPHPHYHYPPDHLVYTNIGK